MVANNLRAAAFFACRVSNSCEAEGDPSSIAARASAYRIVSSDGVAAESMTPASKPINVQKGRIVHVSARFHRRRTLDRRGIGKRRRRGRVVGCEVDRMDGPGSRQEEAASQINGVVENVLL